MWGLALALLGTLPRGGIGRFLVRGRQSIGRDQSGRYGKVLGYCNETSTTPEGVPIIAANPFSQENLVDPYPLL
ncbi:MAG TPA: hypothetical protein VFB60_22180 [Ktedonobacteraceae bacterium]|nr:hypothetical protein [Ktedonobacteraceae bacterium]